MAQLFQLGNETNFRNSCKYKLNSLGVDAENGVWYILEYKFGRENNCLSMQREYPIMRSRMNLKKVLRKD